MTHNDLVAKLREMLATVTPGRDTTATALLFGVLFNEEIAASESKGSRIAAAIEKDCSSAITDGQALARFGFVQPTAAMVSRWKGPAPTDDDELPGRRVVVRRPD